MIRLLFSKLLVLDLENLRSAKIRCHLERFNASSTRCWRRQVSSIIAVSCSMQHDASRWRSFEWIEQIEQIEPVQDQTPPLLESIGVFWHCILHWNVTVSRYCHGIVLLFACIFWFGGNIKCFWYSTSQGAYLGGAIPLGRHCRVLHRILDQSSGLVPSYAQVTWAFNSLYMPLFKIYYLLQFVLSLQTITTACAHMKLFRWCFDWAGRGYAAFGARVGWR